MKIKFYSLLLIIPFFLALTNANEPTYKLALLKYSGGDWYSNPTALPNLSSFCNAQLGTNIDPNFATVEVGSAELFNHPFVHMTGHGNVLFTEGEAENLRTYLMAGGFLHIDDNYGMDPFVRIAMKEVFPDLEFIEIPFDHPVYHQKFDFNNGVPKIHKHDDKEAKGYGLIYEGRLVCFYSYESDLGDGWEDFEVHKDPQELRIQALRMGCNLVNFAFEGES
ncbi:MAG: DUF4159 domain-containing protein [Saprospiraceae bacterium]|nr:DUF4159 domain-containing protein [Bacteroidia bacterium]NNE16794.1 DUF4159 domain-containing protein [Saprospiraceae bacterium]NNL91724.1 DUF4159 domain-containing protein [Saprospiraceae bacterium]